MKIFYVLLMVIILSQLTDSVAIGRAKRSNDFSLILTAEERALIDEAIGRNLMNRLKNMYAISTRSKYGKKKRSVLEEPEALEDESVSKEAFDSPEFAEEVRTLMILLQLREKLEKVQ